MQVRFEPRQSVEHGPERVAAPLRWSEIVRETAQGGQGIARAVDLLAQGKILTPVPVEVKL